MRHYDQSATARPVISRDHILTDVSCDRCGQSLMRISFPDQNAPEGLRSISETHNLVGATFNFQGNYGSERFDGDTWDADLCEDCALAIKDFIDMGSGVGVAVEIDSDWNPSADEPNVVVAPFSAERIALYRGEYSCHFHRLPMHLQSDGLHCPQAHCSYAQDWAMERDFS